MIVAKEEKLETNPIKTDQKQQKDQSEKWFTNDFVDCDEF